MGQSTGNTLKVGDSGGRDSKTSTVMRIANRPSDNALGRSGVALWGLYQVAFMCRLTVRPEVSKGERDCRFALRYLSTNGSDHTRKCRVSKATWYWKSFLKALRFFATDDFTNAFGDMSNVCLQREVTSIQQFDNGVRIVPLVGFRSGGDEERIVLTPDNE
jgi:hypothetical protein